MFESLAEK